MMSTRKKHQTGELRPQPSAPGAPANKPFAARAAKSADREQAAMARGMQEWFDSFNKSHQIHEDDAEE